jgi:hypothetical protein
MKPKFLPEFAIRKRRVCEAASAVNAPACRSHGTEFIAFKSYVRPQVDGSAQAADTHGSDAR